MSQIIHSECLQALKKLPANSVDAIVTDPPAGIAFMSKSWDRDKGGRSAWVLWLTEIMTEAYHVLKPGGHAVVWSLPRTSHWTACALEDAGFEIRDCLYHFFGSGFPKSHDLSKAIDRRAQVEREVIRHKPRPVTSGTMAGSSDTRPWIEKSREIGYHEVAGPIPVTAEAQRWSGYGTALKPSVETWWLCRKPIAGGSIADNLLTWGVGGLNIDGCRIPGGDTTRATHNVQSGYLSGSIGEGKPAKAPYSTGSTLGRWPSHLLLSHTLYCDEEQCAEDCPVRLLDEQSGVSKSAMGLKGKAGAAKFSGKYANGEIYTDTGGASRYFTTFLYTPKTSRRERNAGCEALPVLDKEDRNFVSGIKWNNDPRSPNGGYENKPCPPLQNNHPTVKPIALMSWLVRLVCPPGGIVLDPFGGSGSTALACIAEGMEYILIEQEAEYVAIAQARIAHMENEVA
jgi:hypothetical protein